MPSVILARCPECAKGLKLKPSAAGRTVKCPACGAPVPVPEAEDDAPRPAQAKVARKRSADPVPEPTGSGNSGELFAKLDLAKYGHDSGRQTALPGRVQKGPPTDEMPILSDAGRQERPPTPLPVVLGIVGGSLLFMALAGGGVAYFLLNS